MIQKSIGILLLALVLVYGCSESTTFGNELIIEEGVDIVTTDTVTLRAKTILSEPTTLGIPGQNFVLGEIDNPTFGKSSSYGYFNLNGIKAYGDRTLDSMVVVLNYDYQGFYGDTSDSYDLFVYPLAEQIFVEDALTNKDYALASTEPVASLLDFVPSSRDSLLFEDYLTEEVMPIGSQIRMRLDDEYALDLFNDENANILDANLEAKVKGFQIMAIPKNGNSMFEVSTNSINNNGQAGSGIVVYNRDDSLKTINFYTLRPQSHRHIHDIEGSEIGEVLDQSITDGSPLYVQGQSGVITEFDFSSIKKLGDVSLNLGELIVYIDEEATGDTIMYPVNEILSFSHPTKSEFIIDFGFAVIDRDDDGNRFFALSLTSYLQDVLKEEEEGILHLQVYNRLANPRTNVFYGPGHSTFAPKLNVAYSRK